MKEGKVKFFFKYKEIIFLVCTNYQLHKRVSFKLYKYDHETIICNQLECLNK